MCDLPRLRRVSRPLATGGQVERGQAERTPFHHRAGGKQRELGGCDYALVEDEPESDHVHLDPHQSGPSADRGAVERGEHGLARLFPLLRLCRRQQEGETMGQFHLIRCGGHSYLNQWL